MVMPRTLKILVDDQSVARWLFTGFGFVWFSVFSG